ncbi:CHASE2 domain-containing protein [Phormidium sp. LEGE 05292]|uniref:CHASE2 domain-containing protein n=1 Tax=[Phormidium] sp. LEGE 05292 TaxID=767427 RepID=UPI001880C1EC|nr:CHASE2 domain-containing protein [Phormidium sp. LEGE 05292]MBE9229780.1 CHASE2 domain-containing protein [Phormidium sp. LEGE 05292]
MKSKLKKIIRQWRSVLIIAPSVSGLVIIANYLGFFQLLEWATLDQFFRLRPRESVDSRIVIVTVNESDINYINQWPISDAVLTKLINKLKAQKPKVIGLDIYRDLPVPPGNEELVKLLQSTPNLIGVEKVVGNTVAPSPTLSKLGQVGIADLVIDADGKVRRGLLSIRSQGKTKLSLGTTLALMYLESHGVKLQTIDPKKKILGLGKAKFVPFTGNEGGYIRTNSGGYQILLNYRGSLEDFQTISLQDVLSDRIPPNSMRDRIILIGATGSSLNDLFFTPYNTNLFGSPKRTPGVVIHANLISQILSGALDGRPFIKFWSEPREILWIFLWSFLGVSGGRKLLLAKQFNNKFVLKWLTFSIVILVAGGSLVGGSYLAFLASWWLPVISPLTALITSAIAIAGYHALELQRQNTDLEILLETATAHYDTVTAELEYKAEETARESERKLAQFLEAVPIGIAVIDANGEIYYLNDAAQKLLGKEIIPHTKIEKIPEVYQLYIAGTSQLYPYQNLPIVRALQGESSTVDDLEIQRQNKSIPLESWATPIYAKSGEITYTLLVFRDITERKKSEVERLKLTEQLLALNVSYSRFVPHEFLQLLNKESIVDVQLGDQVQKEMSVLFSDIRNFTSLSESMTPAENFKFINAYLCRMEPAIIQNQGFIDKYIGDAIMALFSGEADNAVKAGIAMLNALHEFNQNRQKIGCSPIQIGIGINTGTMMLGVVGGRSRMESTVVSDAVNLASRLEGLTKNYGVSLLISHYTFLALNDANAYNIRLIDKVKVKGKLEMVTVYEVFDADPPEVKQAKLLTKTGFEQAVLLYNLGRFERAAEIFAKCLSLNPLDKVAQIYWQRCQEET